MLRVTPPKWQFSSRVPVRCPCPCPAGGKDRRPLREAACPCPEMAESPASGAHHRASSNSADAAPGPAARPPAPTAAATHVLFDMDGLLLDTETLYTVAQQQICQRFGREFTWALKAQMMGKKALDAAQMLVDQLGLQGQLTAEEFVQQARGRGEVLGGTQGHRGTGQGAGAGGTGHGAGGLNPSRQGGCVGLLCAAGRCCRPATAGVAVVLMPGLHEKGAHAGHSCIVRCSPPWKGAPSPLPPLPPPPHWHSNSDAWQGHACAAAHLCYRKRHPCFPSTCTHCTHAHMHGMRSSWTAVRCAHCHDAWQGSTLCQKGVDYSKCTDPHAKL